MRPEENTKSMAPMRSLHHHQAIGFKSISKPEDLPKSIPCEIVLLKEDTVVKRIVFRFDNGTTLEVKGEYGLALLKPVLPEFKVYNVKADLKVTGINEHYHDQMRATRRAKEIDAEVGRGTATITVLTMDHEKLNEAGIRLDDDHLPPSPAAVAETDLPF